ncbi:uncharacterized protein MELLADRAFT_91307 [Melampsora larici-populina 98AG31]|uniref:Uncharacterized protein n=1 Tax=Melampsora larici-populina (strain 98AG31 / pathotype 3-4-7) TaxID=747676 RepID=F4RYK0_MELLP|nr:uncharacterized protein MELLADRAFT_91307 [Melampsora larici-populina 98AG31]EGG02564.1 hypothetical protein MELLADRAFT_91307 [Melampsora larici-populina 98AG31]
MCTLDPDAPGVGKQTMLDWLRINHPMETIRTGLNKGEIAQIVRRVQPETNHIQHHVSTTTSLPEPSDLKPTKAGIRISKKNRHETHISSSSTVCSASIQQPLTDPQLASKRKLEIVPGGKVHLGKRSVSGETNRQSKKRVLSGTQSVVNSTDDSDSTPNVKLETTSDSSEARHKQSKSDPSDLSPSPKYGQSYINPAILPSHKKKLQTPPNSARGSSELQSNTLIDLGADNNDILEGGTTTQPRDLMEFADRDWFETENTTVGQDVPPITNNGPIVSGVDVFLKEREHGQKVAYLNNVIESLKSQVDTSEQSRLDDVASIQHKQNKQDDTIHRLQRSVGFLEEKVEMFDGLKEQLNSLETEVKELRKSLGEAVTELGAQEEIITKLIHMQEEDGDEDDSQEYDSQEDDSNSL